MDKLYTSISKLLKSSARLVEHTSLTQNEVGRENTVLWDNRPSLIDLDTYTELKDAIKKRSSKYYMYNHVLSYTDFCIGLLCSLEYSLNHNVTVSIPDRTYTAAWRTIGIISETGRSSRGYCNSLGIELDTQIIPISSQISNSEVSTTIESELVSSISTSDTVVEISHKFNILDNNNETSNNNENKVFDTSFTPEGQLYDLVMVHCIFNKKLF